MDKERLLEVLRLALGSLDILITMYDDEEDSDGCQQEKICEMLGLTDDEFEFIKSGDFDE